MPTSKHKSRRFRGSRTCGFGRVGQHRKAGKHGGKGNAGLHKYGWSYTLRHNPTYFGKHGFNRPPRMVLEQRPLNLNQIESMLDKLLAKKVATEEGKKITVNLTEIGITKVLGSGKLSRPLTITAPSFSKTAIEKIEAAGGAAIVPSA